MTARIGLGGQRFGAWTVIAYARDHRWSCVCDCGTRRDVHGPSLRKGRSRSCGCRQRVDFIGRRFGRLAVVAYAGGGKWTCLCDCGARADVNGNNLHRGNSRSCGCLMRERARERATKHGMSNTREYNSWKAMKQRCFNPNSTVFEHYGGKGIAPCEQWANSFEAFFADTGERPPGCTLDRIDPSKGYEPSNVRWADAKQQSQNRRPPKRKPRRSNLADIQAYAESLARAGRRP